MWIPFNTGLCSKLLHIQGDWGIEHSNNWLCCIIANYKFSVLDNLNTKQNGLYRIYRFLLIQKMLQLDHSELSESFRTMTEEAVRDWVLSVVLLCPKLGLVFSVASLTHLFTYYFVFYIKEYTINLPLCKRNSQLHYYQMSFEKCSEDRQATSLKVCTLASSPDSFLHSGGALVNVRLLSPWGTEPSS